MDTKICNKCKKEFPKTTDYFFTKNCKNSKGISKWRCFRNVCKKCHSIIVNEKRIKKMCLELNCKIEDYRENWKKQYSETRIIFPEIKNLPETVRRTLRDKIRNGYKFTTYEQYKKDCNSALSKRKRKYDYGEVDFISSELKNNMAHEKIVDARIANTYRIPVSDMPKELIENLRLVIKLKRMAGLTHSTLPENNINNKYAEKWKQKEI